MSQIERTERRMTETHSPVMRGVAFVLAAALAIPPQAWAGAIELNDSARMSEGHAVFSRVLGVVAMVGGTAIATSGQERGDVNRTTLGTGTIAFGGMMYLVFGRHHSDQAKKFRAAAARQPQTDTTVLRIPKGLRSKLASRVAMPAAVQMTGDQLPQKADVLPTASVRTSTGQAVLRSVQRSDDGRLLVLVIENQ